MTHPLDNRLALDLDVDHRTGWGGGLKKLADVRLEDGQRIEVVFFDPHLKRPDGTWVADADALDEAARVGLVPGMRFVPEWLGGQGDPYLRAKQASDYIDRLDGTGTPHAAKRVQVVEYDCETHDVGWQIKFLLGGVEGGVVKKGIRGAGGKLPNPADHSTLGYRWGRPFLYSFEGGQTSAQSAGNIAAQAGGKVCPQPYNGPHDGVPDMAERWDWHREIVTWAKSGLVPVQALIPAVDAKKENRPLHIREGVLFAASRFTELIS